MSATVRALVAASIAILAGCATPLSPGVAGASMSKLKSNESGTRSVVAEFNGERIAVRSWPARENRVVFAEFHY